MNHQSRWQRNWDPPMVPESQFWLSCWGTQPKGRVLLAAPSNRCGCRGRSPWNSTQMWHHFRDLSIMISELWLRKYLKRQNTIAWWVVTEKNPPHNFDFSIIRRLAPFHDSRRIGICHFISFEMVGPTEIAASIPQHFQNSFPVTIWWRCPVIFDSYSIHLIILYLTKSLTH